MIGPISTLGNAAYSTGTSVATAVRNNPKRTAALVLTAATGAAAYYNAPAITAFATAQLTSLAEYSPMVRDAAEYLNLLAPVQLQVKNFWNLWGRI